MWQNDTICSIFCSINRVYQFAVLNKYDYKEYGCHIEHKNISDIINIMQIDLFDLFNIPSDGGKGCSMRYRCCFDLIIRRFNSRGVANFRNFPL